MIKAVLTIKTVAGLNAREHFRVRAKRVKAERFAAFAKVKLLVPAHIDLLPCTVTLTRISAGTLDSDNLQGAFKAIRDGVADALRINDNDPRVDWKYAQELCRKGEYAVTIEIT